jgi:pyruvate carboxylase
MGAVVAALEGSERDTGLGLAQAQALNGYWEQVRGLYAPFESGLKSGGADVYMHEMPGGQYTNLQFQARALGLTERWPAIKKAYTAANRLLGDLIKVTPSSKVVGDLAQFMVQNDLDEDEVRARAETLSFPRSVVEFFQGHLGVPYGGYPEPLRTQVVRGLEVIEGRPGASLPALDLATLEADLRRKWGEHIRSVDVISAALYPKVFEEYMRFRAEYSDVSLLPTRNFIAPMKLGEEISFEIERGKLLIVKLTAIGDVRDDGQREVFFELNGQPRSILVPDASVSTQLVSRERARVDDPGSVGAPMPGVVVELRVEAGDRVAAGDPLVVLSAMKMETVVAAPCAGEVTRVAVTTDEALAAGDLLVEIDPG